jgi:hypothetical protein
VGVGDRDRKCGFGDLRGEVARDGMATVTEQRRRQRGAGAKELNENRVFARGHRRALGCTGDASDGGERIEGVGANVIGTGGETGVPGQG